MSRPVLYALIAIALLAALVAAVLTAMPRSAKAPVADNTLSDYWQRHPDLSIPVTGKTIDTRSSDWFQRHLFEAFPGLGGRYLDYAARHPELSVASTRSVDLTDYAARHPGMTIQLVRPIDTTDYYFRHLSR